MRFIDIDSLNLPERWKERAQRAIEEVCNAFPPERSQIINRYSSLWSDIKSELARLSFDKCWYCETKIERTDADVDHFRPKARVKTCVLSDSQESGVVIREVSDHEGYWWLAFDWRNYRYSCRYCNARRKDEATNSVGGKGDLFPLLDEATRAYDPTDDIDQEEKALLDPTDPTDPTLLWFDPNGRAVPRPNIEERERERVLISVNVYHLNYSRTRQSRQTLWNYIKRLVNDLDKAIIENNERLQKRVFRDLLSHLNPQASYSAAARCFLMGLRSETNAEVIEQLLQVA